MAGRGRERNTCHFSILGLEIRISIFGGKVRMGCRDQCLTSQMIMVMIDIYKLLL